MSFAEARDYGTALSRDLTPDGPADLREKTLERFLTRRYDKRQGDAVSGRSQEDWEKSSRRLAASRAEELRQERIRYHEVHARRLTNTMGDLVSHHLAEAARWRGSEAS